MNLVRIIKRYVIDAISMLYPYRLLRSYSILLDILVSRRFERLSGNTGRASLKRPLYISGYKYIKYESICSGPGLRLECLERYRGQEFSPEIIFGKNVSINYRCHIGAINKIVIGDNVLIGSNVLITDHSHGYNDARDVHTPPIDRILYSKGPVIIEDNVWICENVSILPGVTIGRNSIIGANSVVTKSIPAFCIASGNPAKVIREIPHNV